MKKTKTPPCTTGVVSDKFGWSHSYTLAALEKAGVKPKRVTMTATRTVREWDMAEAVKALQPLKDAAVAKRLQREAKAKEAEAIQAPALPAPALPAPTPALTAHEVAAPVLAPVQLEEDHCSTAAALRALTAAVERIEVLLTNHLTRTGDGVSLLVRELCGVATAAASVTKE